MRLVCPNCDAEYEVDASVIPEAGRDVQCSNCGHAWFQASPEVEAELAAEAALYEAPPARAEEDEPDDFAPLPAAVPQRTLDTSVLDVLREEAEREVEARKAEAPRIEVQTDMALEPAATESAGLGAVARRLARMKGEPAKVDAKPQTRADAFPEIEEINSTLRASSEKRSGAAALAQPEQSLKAKGSGFRSGFTLMLILGAIIALAYVMAPKLAAQFPAAAPMLDQFVAIADRARTTLDGLLQAAIKFLQGLASGS